ncbi:hypothetical protein EMCRGX_G010971 [Ephydatia muelleri]
MPFPQLKNVRLMRDKLLMLLKVKPPPEELHQSTVLDISKVITPSAEFGRYFLPPVLFVTMTALPLKDLITPSNSSNITISINIRITINISICINSSINIIININITINISNFISINLNSSISISINISLNINLRFINEEC